MRSRFPHAARVAVALSAAAGAIIAASVIAGTGSAQSSPTTLQLVGTAQKGIGFGPDHKPHQGDRVGGGSKIAGDDTGLQRSVCTRIGTKAICTVELQLSKGTLSAQGLVPDRADHTPITITGGTGSYDGARGTAVATQVSRTRTLLTVTLLP